MESAELRAAHVVLSDRILRSGCLRLDADGRIDEIRGESFVSGPATWMTPGCVDLQVNGYDGIDLMEADADAFRELGRRLLRAGVTSFCPTLITAPPEVLDDRLRLLAAATRSWPDDAARVLGFHLEGPFLGDEKRGVHRRRWLRRPTRTLLESWIASSGERVRIVTLAPELEGAEEVIPFLVERGIRVSLGHSSASYECAKRAIDLGATMCTHFGNAMEPIAQREPGLALACLDDSRVFLCVIPDLVHVHAALLDLAARCKAPDRLCLVSDCTAAAGRPDGVYSLGSVEIRLVEGRCEDREGRLAGSALGLFDGLGRFARATGLGPLAAARAAATAPAQALGLADLGRIEVGARADLCRWSLGAGGQTVLREVVLGGKGTLLPNLHDTADD